MTKSFKESLTELLKNAKTVKVEGKENSLHYITSLNQDLGAILKLISKFAPKEHVGNTVMYKVGYQAGIKAYKQSLGVDE